MYFIRIIRYRWFPVLKDNVTGKVLDCKEADKAKDDTPELGLDNVGGVFLVLCVGIILSLFLGTLEFLWAVRQTSIEFKVIYFIKKCSHSETNSRIDLSKSVCHFR